MSKRKFVVRTGCVTDPKMSNVYSGTPEEVLQNFIDDTIKTVLSDKIKIFEYDNEEKIISIGIVKNCTDKNIVYTDMIPHPESPEKVGDKIYVDIYKNNKEVS